MYGVRITMFDWDCVTNKLQTTNYKLTTKKKARDFNSQAFFTKTQIINIPFHPYQAHRHAYEVHPSSVCLQQHIRWSVTSPQ